MDAHQQRPDPDRLGADGRRADGRPLQADQRVGPAGNNLLSGNEHREHHETGHGKPTGGVSAVAVLRAADAECHRLNGLQLPGARSQQHASGLVAVAIQPWPWAQRQFQRRVCVSKHALRQRKPFWVCRSDRPAGLERERPVGTPAQAARFPLYQLQLQP